MLPSSLPHAIVLPSGESASAHMPPSPFHGSPTTSPVSQLHLRIVPSHEPLTVWALSCKKMKLQMEASCPANSCLGIGLLHCAGAHPPPSVCLTDDSEPIVR